MTRFTDCIAFAEQYVGLLPLLQDVETRPAQFWELLEVNSDRVLADSRDVDYVRDRLSPVGPGGLQSLCVWAGLQPNRSKADLELSLAGYLAANVESPGCQLIILTNEFLHRRRPDAIEAISRLMLPDVQFALVRSATIDAKSKRLCYTILVFLANPHQLRLLMLFESAERAGYTRHVLIPKTEGMDEEAADLAHRRIEVGGDLAQFDVAGVNDILEGFERRHGHRQSLCYELFRDDQYGMTLVFIFRYLREARIREVDDVVFAQEAELVVLRLYDSMRTIEQHSSSGVGVQIATAMASELVGDSNVQYVEDTQLTSQQDLGSMIDALVAEQDERVRLQELYLKSAPIEGAPVLILRCDKRRSLSDSLAFLRERSLDLLQDLSDIRNIDLTFVIEAADGRPRAYIFKIYCKMADPGRYYLPYSVANVLTQIRADFETYLRQRYNVRAIPGTA